MRTLRDKLVFRLSQNIKLNKKSLRFRKSLSEVEKLLGASSKKKK